LAKKARTKLASAKLKRRRASIDVKIARDKKKIKSLKKQTRKRERILAGRLRARSKLK
jgi:hypothetical protein